MASAFMVGPSAPSITASTTQLVTVDATTTPITVKQRVSAFFKDDPIMVKIAWCESRDRQFAKDGSVFRGKVNPNDVGVMQVNTDYHLKRATDMGLDIMTIDGNMAYAKFLYEKQGTAPWNSSSPCWDNEVAMK